jgi:hypothetical protein
MNSEVTAAIIAAGASILILIGTVIAQIIGFRSTKADTEQQIKAVCKDTADTLEQQREQIDKTLKTQAERPHPGGAEPCRRPSLPCLFDPNEA